MVLKLRRRGERRRWGGRRFDSNRGDDGWSGLRGEGLVPDTSARAVDDAGDVSNQVCNQIRSFIGVACCWRLRIDGKRLCRQGGWGNIYRSECSGEALGWRVRRMSGWWRNDRRNELDARSNGNRRWREWSRCRGGFRQGRVERMVVELGRSSKRQFVVPVTLMRNRRGNIMGVFVALRTRWRNRRNGRPGGAKFGSAILHGRLMEDMGGGWRRRRRRGPRHRSTEASRPEAGFEGGTKIFEFCTKPLDVIGFFGFGGSGLRRFEWGGRGGDIFTGEEATEISDKSTLGTASGNHRGNCLAGDGVDDEFEDVTIDGGEWNGSSLICQCSNK